MDLLCNQFHFQWPIVKVVVSKIIWLDAHNGNLEGQEELLDIILTRH